MQAVHLLLLDARLAAGIGAGLDIHQDGNDLVAEASFGKATDLQVALVQSRILRYEAIGEMVIDLVDVLLCKFGAKLQKNAECAMRNSDFFYNFAA